MEDEGSELAVEERAEQEDGESRSTEEENAVESAVGESAKQEQGVDELAIGNNTHGGLELTPGDGSAQVYGYFDYVRNVYTYKKCSAGRHNPRRSVITDISR